LNDFLFHSAKRLAALRTLVQETANGSIDNARYYVLQSDLTRGFQAVQTAHHRFEFAAGELEASDNFRLDAASRSARGLRRRSQKRIRLIDERLQADAAGRARQQRELELAETRRFMQDVRERVDKTVEELVSLQEELNLNTTQREEFLRAILQRDLIKSQSEQTKRDLLGIQEQVRQLTAKRTAGAEANRLELVSCEVIDGPINLQERCRTGGIGAVLTFLALALGQWWITRRL
jgi:hypothetical protein